jgi:hypothetical protein
MISWRNSFMVILYPRLAVSAIAGWNCCGAIIGSG